MALMRRLLTIVVCLVGVWTTTGCRPSSPPDEELGTVIYEVPQLPGSDQPYPLPELGPDAEKPDTQKPGEPPATAPPAEPSGAGEPAVDPVESSSQPARLSIMPEAETP